VSQLTLLTVPPPALPDGIDLRCCSVEDLLANVDGLPTLIVADPPWHYSQAPGHSANPENHYETTTDAQIADILAGAYTVAAPAARLALWATWPKLQQWTDAVTDMGKDWRWRYVSGGAWTKTGGSPGTGFHWLGQSEPVILYVKGTRLCTEWGALTNAHSSERQRHSEKPWQWMAGWIERWTEPGDLVLDLYAGMAPLARACVATGRRYLGAEIDPVRHRQAVDRLALFRRDHE
jgi:hypothetical protein